MILRRPTVEDTPQILELDKKYSVPIPVDFYHAAVIEKDGKIVAFGVLRSILEGMMIVTGSPRQVIECTTMLMNQAKVDSKGLKFDQIYTFVEKDETFGRVLTEVCGMREFPGKFFVLDLEK
jgi:hypothetical protein